MFSTIIFRLVRQALNRVTPVIAARVKSMEITQAPKNSIAEVNMFRPQSFKITLLTLAFLLASFALPLTVSGQLRTNLLDVPVVGQCMGYNIQDFVDIEISRYGDIITVKRQGQIVFQGRDTTAAGMFNSGKIAITSRPGACGPALDEISVSDQALPPPKWAGPVDQKDFTFFFNEGSGNLINSADGKHWGEVELGWGYKSGEWVDDGAKPGNKSWSSWIGTARIHRVQYSSQYTLEGFFKVPSNHKLRAGSRFRIPLLFMQIQGNNNPWNRGKIVQPEQPRDADWDRERGGVFVQENNEGKLLLIFHILPPGKLYVEGPAFTYDKWHHVALVRDGVNYKLYLDREKVCDTLFSRWGKANLVKGILSTGQNVDNDMINYRSNAAYLFVDQIRLTSRVLNPDQFLSGAEPAYSPPDRNKQPKRLTVKFSDNFDDGNADGWTPDSAGNWRVTDGVYHVYRGVMPGIRKKALPLCVASVWEDCRLEGNFTIYARMGISPTAQMADPDDPENMNMGEDWYKRNYALAFCYQDDQNSYVADFFPHWSWSSGIVKISYTPIKLPEVLERSVALYQSLHGYRDTTTEEVHYFKPGMDTRLTVPLLFAFERPNRLRFETRNAPEGMGAALFDDGTKIVSYNEMWKQYKQEDAPAVLSIAVLQGRAAGPAEDAFVPRMLLSDEPLKELLNGAEKAELISSEDLDGTPVTVVELTKQSGSLPGYNPVLKNDVLVGLRVWIGSEDFLIRKMAFELDMGEMAGESIPQQQRAMMEGMKINYMLKHTAIETNPVFADKDFAFTPPEGSKLVEEFMSPETLEKLSGLVGKPAPGFVLKDLEGQEVKLADFAGKVIIIDFWATWCPPCVEEIPEFVKLYRDYKDKGLVIIGISLDQGGIEVVKNFAAQYKVNYLLVMGDQKVTEAYGGISAIPTTFVIDLKGNIVDGVVGGRPKSYFEKKIRGLF